MRHHSRPSSASWRHSLLAPVLTVTLLAMAILPAGAQDNPLFRHIPPDAAAVYHVNLASISSKIGWQDLIKNIPLGKMKMKQEQQDAIMDPSSAGVDIRGSIVIANSNSDMLDSAAYTTFMAQLVDSAKFRKFVHGLFPDIHIRSYPDKSYAVSDKTACIAWNKNMAVLVHVRPPIKALMDRWQDKSKKGKEEPGKPMTVPSESEYRLAAQRRCLSALKGFDHTYYTTDPIFKAEFSNDADIQMCMEHGSYLKGLSKMIPPKAMGGMNPDAFDLFDKKFTEVRFENGGLTVRGRLILKPDVAASLEKYHAPAFNNDLVARLPKGKLLAMVSVRTDLSMFGDMMKKFGMSQKLDSALAEKGLSLSDLANALKGDFLLAVLGTDKKDSAGKPKPDIYFIASVGDLSALHNLGMELMKAAAKDSATAAADTSKHKKHDDFRHIVENAAVHDGLLVISGSKEASEGYFSNTERRNTDFLTDNLRQSPSFLWIDLKAIISYLGDALSGQPNQEKTKAILEKLSVLDKLILSGGAIHNGEINTSFELRTSNPNENILKTLMSLAH
ncbi:MAG: DUF4836 family protein [Bacteroidota bacterium]|nr:DUF4836 family protein [Bacteroidota bacterium]MDP4215735.1 DUF4836 family protein [Bacteroidota bacterium]MDP4254504.1 DUF4836 family protein [Bacteroidota bacterium]MDP4259389.1 DUF4836 family protein [Bacteroidota bacterium]